MVSSSPNAVRPTHRKDIGIVSVIHERLRHQCDAAVSSQGRTLHAESITEALTVLRTASPSVNAGWILLGKFSGGEAMDGPSISNPDAN